MIVTRSRLWHSTSMVRRRASSSAVTATTTEGQQIFEKVVAVYEEVVKEFYSWEQEYCKNKLSGLSPGLCTKTEADDDLFPFPCSDSVESDSFYVTKFNLNADPVTETVSCPTYIFPTVEAGKPYESCTFSHKNIYIADDMCDKLSFVPFADNPQFPVYDYMNVFDGIGWETYKDPDRTSAHYLQTIGLILLVEVIAAEAARRLHFGHTLSFKEIDQTGILPFPIVESHGKKGLLQILNQRPATLQFSL